MLRYGLYARKSHDDPKRTAKSIGEQIAECRRIAERAGLSVAYMWEESRSAKTPGRRPKFKELLQRIEASEIDAILCWHVNRLARNMAEGGTLVQLLIDGKLKEVRTPHAVYRTGENILPIVVEAASAAQYSLDLTRDVKRSMEGNFRSGGCNHRTPPGYCNARDPHNLRRGVVECDGERFALIRKFWDLILTDAFTVTAALRILTDDWGFRRRPTANQPAHPISSSAAYDLLRNPFYAGFVREHGELVRGRHKPMVTLAEFERVQEILRRRGFTAAHKHEHTYRGLIRCGYCGQQVTGEFKVLRSGAIWETYHCSDSYRRCTRRGLSLAGLEQQFERILAAITIDPEVAAIARAAVLAELNAAQPSIGTVIEPETVETETQRRIDRIDEMWISGLLQDKRRYAELRDREENRLNAGRLAAERRRTEQSRIRANLDRASRYASQALSAFQTGDAEQRRLIVSALGLEMRLFGKEKLLRIGLPASLREFVNFAHAEIAPLEPGKTGYHKQKGPFFEQPFVFGGPCIEQLAPILKSDCEQECQEAPVAPMYQLMRAMAVDLLSELPFIDAGSESQPIFRESKRANVTLTPSRRSPCPRPSIGTFRRCRNPI